MTILVDQVRHYPDRGLRFTAWSHLVSDAELDELHDFAAGIGLERRWFQGDHYDLPGHLRDRAVARGAVSVDSRELARRMAGRRRRQRAPVELS